MEKETLRAWRKARALTQREAADTVGISRRSWQDYEAGVSPIPLAIAYACRAISAGLLPL
jgi:DNA-binding XRE family transcriptional regulator